MGFFICTDIYNKIKIMKHILNNLTEEEKDSIRRQHSNKIVSEQTVKPNTDPNANLGQPPKGMLKSCNPTTLKGIKNMFFGESDNSIKIENNVSFGERNGGSDVFFITAQGAAPCWCKKADFQKL